MRYLAKNGCVYDTTINPAKPIVVAQFSPRGMHDRQFGDAGAQQMAETCAAALNTAGAL